MTGVATLGVVVALGVLAMFVVPYIARGVERDAYRLPPERFGWFHEHTDHERKEVKRAATHRGSNRVDVGERVTRLARGSERDARDVARDERARFVGGDVPPRGGDAQPRVQRVARTPDESRTRAPLHRTRRGERVNGKRLAEALQALIAERRASGRVFEREYPKLAAAIDEVLHIFRAGQR